MRFEERPSSLVVMIFVFEPAEAFVSFFISRLHQLCSAVKCGRNSAFTALWSQWKQDRWDPCHPLISSISLPTSSISALREKKIKIKLGRGILHMTGSVFYLRRKAFTARTYSKGARGQPWRMVRDDSKGSDRTPLTSTSAPRDAFRSRIRG